MVAPVHGQTRRSSSKVEEPAKISMPASRPPRTAAISPKSQSDTPAIASKSIVMAVMLADVGYSNGFRLSNLGGRREIYIPLPQGIEIVLSDLVLKLDDVSAHDARRSLEVLVNDRLVSAIALDGKSTGRIVRISVANASALGGFLKVSFLYSGAATPDRCVDVRYVGDSVTVLPKSALEFEISTAGPMNITAAAALLPHNVAILLSNPNVPPADVATALTLARSLTAAGRRVTFHYGMDALPQLVKREDPQRLTNGLVIVGAFDRTVGRVDKVLASSAGAVHAGDTMAVARIAGAPVLLVADVASARAGRLFGNPALAALRDTPAASIGRVASVVSTTDRVRFDQLGLAPAQTEVFSRAELAVVIASRMLPSGTRPSRVLLDVMVAPDGAGENAVVSAFVNERLLASTVAAVGQPTRLDISLPEGLVGTVANIRVVVQRRSAQGDCRFEPQGYPAEIQGSSSVILSKSASAAAEFSDFTAVWSGGVEVIVPASTATEPLQILGLLADVLNALSTETTPIAVRYFPVRNRSLSRRKLSYRK